MARIQYVKEQVTVDVVRITTVDERWYRILERDYPSSTWISSYIKKDDSLIKWYAEHGWDHAKILRHAAGNKGSRVHQAIHDYVQGQEIRMDAQYMNHDTEQPEELTIEEYDAIVSFDRWVREAKPVFVDTEKIVFNEEVGYAGTLDLIVKIEGVPYVVDVKTSKDIYLEHELQISSYKHALKDPETYKLAILQVGYARNKKEFKFTEIDDRFDLFLAAKQFWANDNASKAPAQKDYPVAVRRPEETPAAPAVADELQPALELVQPPPKGKKA